jgi:hypothetical protein
MLYPRLWSTAGSCPSLSPAQVHRIVIQFEAPTCVATSVPDSLSHLESIDGRGLDSMVEFRMANG